MRRTTIFRDFVPSFVAVKRLKREARLSGPLALVLAGSGRGQESLRKTLRERVERGSRGPHVRSRKTRP